MTDAGKRTLTVSVKIAVSSVLLFYIINNLDWTAALATARSANPRLLLVAFVLMLVCVFISTLKWQIIIRHKGPEPSFSSLLRNYFVGLFFNNFLPTSMGGDAVRALLTRPLFGSLANSAGAVFIERFTGLIVLILLGLAGSLFYADLQLASLTRPFFLLGSILALTLFMFPARKLDRFSAWKALNEKTRLIKIAQEALHVDLANLAFIANVFFLSAVFQVLSIVAIHQIALAVGIGLSIFPFVFVVPLVALISMAPVAINGIGLREGAFITGLAAFGVPTEQALVLSLLLYGFQVLLSLAGAPLYVSRSQPAA